MDREKYRPVVVVWNFSDHDKYVFRVRALGIPLYSFSQKASPLAKITTLTHLVRKLRPEVIHSYSFYTNLAAWVAALGTQVIAVGAVRSDIGNDKKCCGSFIGNLSARWPRGQIYNNFASAEKTRRSRSLFTPKQIWIVRNGLDLHEFATVPLSMNRRVRIVGVGSLLHIKRWDRLLVAAKLLKEEGLDFIIKIAGTGPLLSLLESQSRALGVEDQVQFAGYVDNIQNLLAESTFLAHTSDIEGCPNAVMEAMACGRAVVAADAGDISYLVEDGKTGFVVSAGDDKRFVQRLATLIQNRDLCCQMGQAARIKAEQEFGLTRLIEETLASYRLAGWKDSIA
jgi:glycosyltransferase involved in cell wall biosynthesis